MDATRVSLLTDTLIARLFGHARKLLPLPKIVLYRIKSWEGARQQILSALVNSLKRCAKNLAFCSSSSTRRGVA
jgi:hypothetical protein